MDTAEARTTPTGEAGGPVYDAFLSYSHAADELLAPRLQAGLQRFAKPWWKRQALRVFRDEGSLSANPHLWSSITEALDDSGWFVLLLSPDAAGSPWVDREVEYWLERQDPDRIIPVLTDGDFSWSGLDVAGDAVPPALQGAFADEPRWVDLRFAKSEEQLDLKNARFRDAIADIASAVRGVPKDELESEEVRQHRRTVRTAWAAGTVVLVLAVVAAAAALFALDQRNDARSAAAHARARELASAALLHVDADSERSILLALEGVETAGGGPGGFEAVSALRQALAATRVEVRVAGGDFVTYSPDGSLVATTFLGDIAIWDAATGQPIRTLPSTDGRLAVRAASSPDGRSVAVAYRDAGTAGPPSVLWDVSTGDVVATFDDPTSSDARGVFFSADGELLAVEMGSDLQVAVVAGSGSPSSVVVREAASGAERYRISYGEGHRAVGASFSPDGTMLAVTDSSSDPRVPSRVVLYDALTGTELDSLGVGELSPNATAFDPTGRRLAAVSQFPPGVHIWDVNSRELVMALPPLGAETAVAWRPDGDVIAVSGNDGIVRLFDAETGDDMLALVGHDSAIWSLAFSPDGAHLAGAGLESDTLVWDITPVGSREVATLATSYSGGDPRTPWSFWLWGVRYDADGNAILAIVLRGSDARLMRLDAATGEILAEIPNQQGAWPTNPYLFPEAGMVATLTVDHQAALRDAETFATVTPIPDGQFVLAVSPDGRRVALGSLGAEDAVIAEVGTWEVVMSFEDRADFARFSPDGTMVSAYNGFGWNGLYDIESGANLLAEWDTVDDEGAPYWFVERFSPDGSLLAVRTITGRAGLLDVAALRAGVAPEDALVVDVDAHNGVIPDNVPFSPDSSLFATWGLIDRHIRVWGTSDGQLVADLGEIEPDWPGFDFHPNGRHFIAEGPDGTLRVYTLDHDELVRIARSRVTRTLTEDECADYRIDPCPTLEDIKTGSA